MSLRETGMKREPFPGFPPPLTNRPEGLLSLLGIQNNGRYPQHLAYDQLLPTVDLLKWYAEAEQDYPTVTQNLTAAGFTAYHTVPSDEQWVLLGCGVETSGNLANSRNQLTIAKANAIGIGVIPLSDPYTITSGAFRVLIGADGREQGMLLRPTTQLGLWQGTVTAADSFTFVARVVRLQVA